MEDRLRVEGGQIKQGELFIFGPTDAFLADHNELTEVGAKDGVLHLTLPKNMDVAFAVKGKVAVGEFKRPHDLVSSQQNRRLQRQVRTMLTLGDIVCVFMRGYVHDDVCHEVSRMGTLVRHYVPQQFWGELANLQTLGVYLLPLSGDDDEALEELEFYRKALGGNAKSAIAGHDQIKKSNAPGAVLKNVQGVGPAMMAKLIEAHGTAGGVVVASKMGNIDKSIPQRVRDEIGRTYWGH